MRMQIYRHFFRRCVESDYALRCRPYIVLEYDPRLCHICADVCHDDIPMNLEHAGEAARSHVYQFIHRLALRQERELYFETVS